MAKFYEGTLTCNSCHHTHDITPEDKMTLSNVTKGWECLACGSTTSSTLAEDPVFEVEHYADLVKEHLKAGTVEDLNEAQGWARALIEEAQLLKEALDVAVQKTRKALTKRPKTKPQR